MSDKPENKTAAPELPIHWAIMKQMNEELYQKATDWRVCLFKNEVIPPKYKELMMVAMFCAIRNGVGVKTHAQFALAKGATKEEIFATVAQSMLVGGVPGYREAIVAIQDLLK